MQTNLINSYIQNKPLPQNNKKASDNIEIVTRRKAKPDFDINRELANRTFIRPLAPKGHIIKDNIWAAPAAFANNMIYDMRMIICDKITINNETGAMLCDRINKRRRTR